MLPVRCHRRLRGGLCGCSCGWAPWPACWWSGPPLAAVGVAALWPLTPTVAGAEGRIQQRLSAHSAADLYSLPTPDRTGRAVIATEDARFFSHHGLDSVGLLRSAFGVASQRKGDPGGATLDQQLAKNLYTGRSWVGQLAQVELSFKLENAYSKDQILEMYLSTVYFGHGFYGLSAASSGYFGVPPSQLSWAQASLLAGLVQAPSAYDPYSHRALARSRQRHVLDRLVAVGTLSAAQADRSYASPLGFR